MSKRKGEGVGDAAAVKRLRPTAVGTQDAPQDTSHPRAPSGGSPHSATGDIGLIESISLKNFMCHHLFGPFHFGPNVNFIVGNNGSGKSAIVAALIVGLGGKATFTNRGGSLKEFVKAGENAADITVKLRNRGPDAYKIEVYGDSITVEQRLSCDGSRTCKLKSKSGQLVSNKKEELTAILDHFNIQLDNPVSILNQEMSKQFLHSKNEADKYKFFMKATLLEQMKRDYIHIKQTKMITRQQVERQEESLKDLKLDYLQKKDKFEKLSTIADMKATLERLKKEMAWCLVREKEHLVEQLREEIKKEESNFKHQENLQLCQTKVTQIEKKLQHIKSSVDTLRQEEKSVSGDSRRLKEQMKIINKAHKDQELVYFRALNKLKQSEQEQNLLQERINKAKTSVNQSSDGETQYAKQQKKISQLRDELVALEKTCSQLNEEIADKQQALIKGKEERDKLRLEERNVHILCASKEKSKTQLLASRTNKLRRFGDRVPDLLAAIAEACAAKRFFKRPLGPIGVCMSLKNPSLAVAVESCLRSFMKAFCCDNYHDEALLQDLMSPYYPRGKRPPIIVCPFTKEVYNTEERKAFHPEYPTMLDTITATDPVILNCLIDMRGIESILIIKEKAQARRVMQQGQPPRNCREAFTMEGDQVYPNRYYTQDFSTAKYLGGDLEAEIRVLETELENHRAQLSRFKQHLASVSEDILRMENQLSRTIANLKKTQASITQLKATIAELETAGEEQIDDITSLEEVARENQQRIEAERQSVHEVMTELDQRREGAEDMQARYSSVRERLAQLPDDMEPLKEEQLKAEAELAKEERNLKILEDKLKAHEDNIHVLKSELAEGEKELEESVAKAAEICPERQQVTRNARSIDMEITQLKKKIQVHESSHGQREAVIREYAGALSLYREKTKQARDLRRFIDQLDSIISDRQNRYKVLRRSLSVRCKLYFNNFLIKIKCSGSMDFDHNNELLSISVNPAGSEDNEVSDMRSLSGGERSFSTVCFMLSLWEITESPFRCLDEFDVYMDMHNRSVSLNLLLELSERQHLRQFIFITPLSTSHLPKSSLIKIHQLQPPESGDEDV